MRTLDPNQLQAALRDARRTTIALLDDLDDAQWEVPQVAILNRPLWELGHIGWFMEFWCLRGGDRTRPALLQQADDWYDSSAVPHARRWQLPLPSRGATHGYVADVLERTLARLAQAEGSDASLYPYRLALFHEDMHGEAFVLLRQAMAYPAPLLPTLDTAAAGAPAHRRDIPVAGGDFVQGVVEGPGFRFDNEADAHAVTLSPYAIAADRVSNAEFAAFIADGGYADDRLWSDEGRAWRRQAGASAPAAWRRIDGQWQQRAFDRWCALEPHAAVRHVNAFEAEAWCRWSQRRLPTESEWEFAAVHGLISPWAARSSVWEWTASAFAPYPGFAPGPYRDYSQPWFHSHRVLRGSSSATPARLRDPRFRNFYTPERRDMLAGFRSCAL